jgi:hypothetical protein
MAGIYIATSGSQVRLAAQRLAVGIHWRDRISSAVVIFGDIALSAPAADRFTRITFGCKQIHTVTETGGNEPVVGVEYGPSLGLILLHLLIAGHTSIPARCTRG